MKMLKYYLLLTILSSKMFCDINSSELAMTPESLPRLPEKDMTSGSQIVIDRGKGIILIGRSNALVPNEELKGFQGYEVIDLDIPGKKEVLKKRLESLYLHREVTWDTLNQMKIAIIEHYQRQNRPLVVVEIPEQDVSNGVIQLLVIEGTVGEIKIEGNRYFSSKAIRKRIHLQPGDPIRQNKLLRDIQLINSNPFRQANIIYAPGKEQGTTDLIIHVNDRRPYRFYGGLENTGVEITGRNHWFTGFNWGNVSGLGDILSYQFTSSYNTHSFHAHTMQYLCPLPWYHMMNIYGGYSSVHAHLPLPAKRNTGFSGQASMRYIMSLPGGLYLNHDCILGFDWKRTNNNVEFTDDTPTFGSNVNLTQWIFGYRGNYGRDGYRLDFEGEFFWSPGKWIGDQTNADYSSIRPDAKNHWMYFKGILSTIFRLPGDFSLFFRGIGQWSNQNLIPSEQYGLGGYDTVRGYEQRQLSFDTALNFTIEARSPALRVATRNYKLRKQRDAVQLLLFFDYGWGSDKNAVPGASKTGFLAGVGPGIRYTFDPYVTARLDVARKLHMSPRFGGGDIMCHFSFTMSY